MSVPPVNALPLADIEAAAARIAKHVHRTPVFTSSTLDRLANEAVAGDAPDAKRARHGTGDDGAPRRARRRGPRLRIHLKCENLQHTGSFKLRGATNAVMQLSDADAAKGVATATTD